jgi:hypothetical protein
MKYLKSDKEFCGKNIEQMPLLIAEGRVPMSVADLMKRRLETKKNSYIEQGFDTGDAVIYHPDGRIKIVLDSEHLRNMSLNSSGNGKALIIGEDVYKALEGEEFNRKNIGIIDEDLSREDAKTHPVWKVLARDQNLLNDYADFIFSRRKRHYADNLAMGVYITWEKGNRHELHTWEVQSLENWASVRGYSYFGNNGGNFIGIKPEVMIVPEKEVPKDACRAHALEEIIGITKGYSNEEVRRALNPKTFTVAQMLESAGQTSAYAHDQIKKLQNILEQNKYVIIKK